MRRLMVAVEMRLLWCPSGLEVDAIQRGLPVHVRAGGHQNGVVWRNQADQPVPIGFMLDLHGEGSLLLMAVGDQRVIQIE